ncbi:hypothetical protein LCGC14_2600600 [marine sediment metagenome]|uniref:Uncharacterized protein n=1 Tax=marine sediment metagenome TaxID=412755 RepID=A0A0F9AWK1_9ZZZZ
MDSKIVFVTMEELVKIKLNDLSSQVNGMIKEIDKLK